MDLASLLAAVLIFVIALPVLRIWAWCFADLFGASSSLDPAITAMWALTLLTLSLIAIPAYATIGPGRDRWDPSMLWWPWKR